MNLKKMKIKKNSENCLLCKQKTVNDLELGGLKVTKNLRAHYYCLLFSETITQSGDDEQGILGFLASDIIAEACRQQKQVCIYCKGTGATAGCVNKFCNRKFHLPCGIDNNIQQNYNSFTSYCHVHRKPSNVPVRLRKCLTDYKCVICLEQFEPDIKMKDLVWAACCKAEIILHLNCIRQLALSAGYFTKCPGCNNDKEFLDCIKSWGVFVPERDASWETGENAFAELYQAHDTCDVTACICPEGREFSAPKGKWRLVLCNLCGSYGTHQGCSQFRNKFLCDICNIDRKPLPLNGNKATTNSNDAITNDGSAKSIATNKNTTDTVTQRYNTRFIATRRSCVEKPNTNNKYGNTVKVINERHSIDDRLLMRKTRSRSRVKPDNTVKRDNTVKHNKPTPDHTVLDDTVKSDNSAVQPGETVQFNAVIQPSNTVESNNEHDTVKPDYTTDDIIVIDSDDDDDDDNGNAKLNNVPQNNLLKTITVRTENTLNDEASTSTTLTSTAAAVRPYRNVAMKSTTKLPFSFKESCSQNLDKNELYNEDKNGIRERISIARNEHILENENSECVNQEIVAELTPVTICEDNFSEKMMQLEKNTINSLDDVIDLDLYPDEEPIDSNSILNNISTLYTTSWPSRDPLEIQPHEIQSLSSSNDVTVQKVESITIQRKVAIKSTTKQILLKRKADDSESISAKRFYVDPMQSHFSQKTFNNVNTEVDKVRKYRPILRRSPVRRSGEKINDLINTVNNVIFGNQYRPNITNSLNHSVHDLVEFSKNGKQPLRSSDSKENSLNYKVLVDVEREVEFVHSPKCTVSTEVRKYFFSVENHNIAKKEIDIENVEYFHSYFV